MNISGNILSSVVQTRSIERVLAPIAAQVSQLIILNESAKETPGSLPNLTPHAQSVLKATEELVLVGQRLAKDSKDEELQTLMPKACQMIESAGHSMMVASQCLQIQPHDSQAREGLVKAARDVLEGTMKVMLISDDTEVRKIVRAAHWTLDRLSQLKSIDSMKALVESFKGFTEAVMLLSSLCDKRQQDLTQQQPKQRLLVAMATLKKATPMLSGTMQTFVKYPKSTQAKASCDYVLKHIMVAVAEVINIVEKGGSTKPERNEEPGHFAIKIDKAMKELSPEHRYKLSVDFDCLLESIVRHSMAVASALPREHLREGIVKSCKEILRQRTIIQEECINVQDNPGFKQLKADYDENCEAFARDFLILEKHVKNALIGQVVDTFVETVEPLERLIKAATVPLKEKGRLDEKVCLKILEPLETAFLTHLDRVCQVGSSMAASCSDHKRVEVIQAAVNTMERIDPEILPACIAVRQDVLDKRAIQHIKLIHREWKNEVTQLVDSIDELIDRNRFLEVTEAYIKGDITQCREASTIADHDLLAEAANCMLGRAKRVVQVAIRAVDRSQDPVYRNGLLVFVNQLQNIIPVVKASANHTLEHMNQHSAHEKLAEKANELLECVEDVHEGLDPRSHPSILSPLRNNVRDNNHSKSMGSFVPSLSRKPIQHNESYLSNPLPVCSGIMDIQQSLVIPDPSGVASGISGILHDMSLMNRSAKTKAEASYALMPKNLRYPMIQLMRAVYKMDGVEVEACNGIVMQLAKTVADLAGRLADSLNDTEKQRNLKRQADGLLEFTPQVMGTAKASVLKQDMFKAEAQVMVEDWTEKVNDLVKGIGEGTAVWFSVVNMMIEYAKAGDNKKLNNQLEQLDRHMQLLRQTVTSTIETCRALGQTNTGRSSSYSTRAQVVQTHATELTRLVKAISAAASEVSIAEGDASLESNLELLVLMWSVKHMQLFQAISSINQKSLSMTGSLEEAMQSGSQELAEREACSMKKACDALVDTAKKSIIGLKDAMKVEETTAAMSDVDKLSTELMAVVLQQRHGNDGSDTSDPIQPRALLMQRQLQAKVTQLGLLVDESVSDMGLAIDTLTGLALAARQAAGPSQSQLLAQFQTLAENLAQNVSQARQVCSRALLPVTDKPGKEIVFSSVDRMCRLTPTVISEARDLADAVAGAGGRLTAAKREWAANATAILHVITKLPEADPTSVAEIATTLKDMQTLSKLTPQSVSMMMTMPTTVNSPGGGPYQDRYDSSMSHTESQMFSPLKSQLYPPSSHFQMGKPVTSTPNLGASSRSRFGRSTTPPPKVSFRESRGRSVSPVKLKHFGQGTKGEDAPEPLLQHALSSPELSQNEKSPDQLAFPQTSFINNPIAAAALELQQEADRWEEDNNAIVQVAKTLSTQMYHLAHVAKRKTSIESKEDLFKLSKSIAANGKVIVQFAETIAKNCVDKRFSKELLSCAERIPFLSTQLNIISSVKQATPEDESANATLINNAENLMQAVMSTLKAAEGACVKGLKPELEGSKVGAEAQALAVQWKRKLHRYRMIEASSTDTDAFGLRRIRKHISAPTLTEILS